MVELSRGWCAATTPSPRFRLAVFVRINKGLNIFPCFLGNTLQIRGELFQLVTILLMAYTTRWYRLASTLIAHIDLSTVAGLS